LLVPIKPKPSWFGTHPRVPAVEKEEISVAR